MGNQSLSLLLTKDRQVSTATWQLAKKVAKFGFKVFDKGHEC